MKTQLVIFAVLLTAIFVNAQSSTELYKINKEELLQNVKILSSSEFEGRLAGSEGYNKAAHFAADKFYELGLNPPGMKSIFNILI